jgi:hypothetical protein
VSQLSQRTLVRLIELLEVQAACPSDLDVGFDYYRWLYENDFDDWFVTHAQSYYGFEWKNIVIDLRNGQFFFSGNSWFNGGAGSILGRYLSQSEAILLGKKNLERLVALSTTLGDSESLKRSLEIDGLEVDVKQLILRDMTGPISVAAEQSRVGELAKPLSQPEIVLAHSESAAKLFISGEFHPSINESRNFLQELVDQISNATDKSHVHNIALPGGTANRIEYLKKVGFLTSDEEAAFKAAWGMLSAGSHPGIPLREEARIGLVLALEFGQILLIKFRPWRSNSFAKF